MLNISASLQLPPATARGSRGLPMWERASDANGSTSCSESTRGSCWGLFWGKTPNCCFQVCVMPFLEMRGIRKNKEDWSYFQLLLQAGNNQWSAVPIGLISIRQREVLSVLFNNQKMINIIFGQVQVKCLLLNSLRLVCGLKCKHKEHFYMWNTLIYSWFTFTRT